MNQQINQQLPANIPTQGIPQNINPMLPQQQKVGVGVTQVSGLKPKSTVTVRGVDYTLRKDATDSTTVFPYQRMVWLSAGSIPIMGGKAHACYILGIIPPTPNSLETPVSVFAIGFHQQKLQMHPSMLSDADMSRLHYYASGGQDFAVEFVDRFMGATHNIEEQREPISPFPPEIDLGAETPKEQPKKENK